MIVSVFLSVCLSVFGWGVCARYGDDVSTQREMRGGAVVVEDGGAERETGV